MIFLPIFYIWRVIIFSDHIFKLFLFVESYGGQCIVHLNFSIPRYEKYLYCLLNFCPKSASGSIRLAKFPCFLSCFKDIFSSKIFWRVDALCFLCIMYRIVHWFNYIYSVENIIGNSYKCYFHYFHVMKTCFCVDDES